MVALLVIKHEVVAATLPTYAPLLEISAQDLDGLKTDSASFRYSLQLIDIMQAASQKCTTMAQYGNIKRFTICMINPLALGTISLALQSTCKRIITLKKK